MAATTTAWQLRTFATTKELITARVNRRLAAKRHLGEHQWRTLIDNELPPLSNATDQETEEFARQEKARALEELFRSRFAVLIGPAGTGKTSLLTALIKIPAVAAGGVLLLAPTGKARVQLQKRTKNAQAQTLAQFLLGYKRYSPRRRKRTESQVAPIGSAGTKPSLSTNARCSPKSNSPRPSMRSKPPASIGSSSSAIRDSSHQSGDGTAVRGHRTPRQNSR